MRSASLLAIALAFIFLLSSCTSGASDSTAQTSGDPFVRPPLTLSPFTAEAAYAENGALIDASHLQEGYVAASATSPSRLKFQITTATGETYNYDLPNDNTPLVCPLVAGDTSYSFSVWENTSGERYAQIAMLENQQVTLLSSEQPFVRPNVYCNYTAESQSTLLANDLCADAQNEGDAVNKIYDWIVKNVTYDNDKAASLADATGYLPNPDETIASKTGICFDYASLAAAMLRSQGIPCKIITGYVSPDNIYHAWNLVYIDGTWMSARIDIQRNTWTRIDTTFAAGGGSTFIGDGTTYTDRYTY